MQHASHSSLFASGLLPVAAPGPLASSLPPAPDRPLPAFDLWADVPNLGEGSATEGIETVLREQTPAVMPSLPALVLPFVPLFPIPEIPAVPVDTQEMPTLSADAIAFAGQMAPAPEVTLGADQPTFVPDGGPNPGISAAPPAEGNTAPKVDRSAPSAGQTILPPVTLAVDGSSPPPEPAGALRVETDATRPPPFTLTPLPDDPAGKAETPLTLELTPETAVAPKAAAEPREVIPADPGAKPLPPEVAIRPVDQGNTRPAPDQVKGRLVAKTEPDAAPPPVAPQDQTALDAAAATAPKPKVAPAVPYWPSNAGSPPPLPGPDVPVTVVQPARTGLPGLVTPDTAEPSPPPPVPVPSPPAAVPTAGTVPDQPSPLLFPISDPAPQQDAPPGMAGAEMRMRLFESAIPAPSTPTDFGDRRGKVAGTGDLPASKPAPDSGLITSVVVAADPSDAPASRKTPDSLDTREPEPSPEPQAQDPLQSGPRPAGEVVVPNAVQVFDLSPTPQFLTDDTSSLTPATASPGGIDPVQTSKGPTGTPNVAAQPVPMQIVAAVMSTEGPVTELRLSPEELGSVRIEMQADGDRVVMVVSAERQDTLDLLRRNADRLAAELKQAGFEQTNISFGNWAGSQRQGGEDARSAPGAPPLTADSTAPLPAPALSAAPVYAPGSALYLRI